MHRMTPRSLHLGLLAGLALVLVPQLGRAQGSQEVRFETADKVKIKGTFYPSGGGNKSPCVILLHKLGGNRQQEGWDVLAKALQNKGFAVLSFDFRGHNDSKVVDADFFTLPVNKRVFPHSKDVKDRDRIDSKDFVGHKKNAYYMPMLVNDIEAAKNFLDQKNNAGECNSSNLILVGAEDGGALGALWLACQFKKAHYVPLGAGVGGIVDPSGRTEGHDVASAVWLSIPSTLTKQYPVATWLASPGVRDKVPMLFFYGDKDEPAAKAAKYLASSLKSPTRPADSAKLMPKRGTKSAGSELLKSSQGTADEISDYLAKIMEKRGSTVWEKRVTPLQLTLLNLQYMQIALP